jgi:glycosyltransferase involved in cell wall biosynthesis
MIEAKVSVVIPAFNESETIADLVHAIQQRYPDFEIVVIDDGSEDNTATVAADAGARVFSHPYNIGNGAAIKSGIRAASGDIFVFMDADGQHDPEDIQKLLDHFPEYDMVVGARSSKSQASFARRIANMFYNFLGSYVTKFPIKDLTSGFRAVKADVAQSFIYLLPNTYSYPTTITLGVLRSGMSIRYEPIQAKKRKGGSSKIKLFQDGTLFFLLIIRICTLYSPMRVFLPVSFLMFALGFIRYLYTLIFEGRFTNMSALLFVSSIIIFMMSLISEQITHLRFERRAHRTSMVNKDKTSSTKK